MAELSTEGSLNFCMGSLGEREREREVLCETDNGFFPEYNYDLCVYS